VRQCDFHIFVIFEILEEIEETKLSFSFCLSFRNVEFTTMPTVVQFAPQLSISAETLMSVLCLVGLFFSIIIVLGFHWALFFLILWVSYLSLYLVGQTFLSFQWDILLLETGNNILFIFVFHSR
jgi:hypothetical protein